MPQRTDKKTLGKKIASLSATGASALAAGTGTARGRSCVEELPVCNDRARPEFLQLRSRWTRSQIFASSNGSSTGAAASSSERDERGKAGLPESGLASSVSHGSEMDDRRTAGRRGELPYRWPLLVSNISGGRGRRNPGGWEESEKPDGAEKAKGALGNWEPG